MDSQQLTRYFSPRRVVRRRRLATTIPHLNPGRGLCRRHGILAVLLVADRSRVADAFGGVAVGVASAIRVGPTGPAATGEGPRRSGGRGEGRREVLRTQCATLAPSTGAGEERVISRYAAVSCHVRSPPSIVIQNWHLLLVLVLDGRKPALLEREDSEGNIGTKRLRWVSVHACFRQRWSSLGYMSSEASVLGCKRG